MRPSEKIATVAALFVFILSSIALYTTAQHKYGVEIPVSGGSINEGLIGYARFINPILAFTDTDKDITSLVYSGLLKATPEGKLIPDIAESVTVSEDGLRYDVKIKDNIVFHDNKPLTTDDIEFTILRAVDPLTKSVKAPNWAGVTVEKINPFEIRFTLKKPYAPFEENLTLGILPKHIWENVSPDTFDVSQFNKEPIGSGPYQIKSAKKNLEGSYISYELESFDKYSLGKPYIDKINLDFFITEEESVKAFTSGNINLLGGISPILVDQVVNKNDAAQVIKNSLPRVFGIFFNQNTEPLFINKEVRKALNDSVNKQAMIDEILKGYGIEANSPIPMSLSRISTISSTSSPSKKSEDEYIKIGKEILESAGWAISTSTNIYEKKTKDKVEKLSFTITTSNSPELKQAAEILQKQWTKLGAEVNIEVFESSDLTQKVIRPRKYEALLFGQVIGRDLDLYPFWHSSQRVDPGLNIALYANIKADKALETARSISDPTLRIAARSEFEREIANDIPAIFLFSPEFVYLSNENINNVNISSMTESAERFMDIHKWYTETDYRWKKKENL